MKSPTLSGSLSGVLHAARSLFAKKLRKLQRYIIVERCIPRSRICSTWISGTDNDDAELHINGCVEHFLAAGLAFYQLVACCALNQPASA